MSSFYHDSSKEAFWPILHSFKDKYNYDPVDWPTFREVNWAFAEAAAREASAGARVWVTDRLRDRVEIYDRADDGTYAHVRGFGGRGLGRAEFHGPRGVAILADGRVVVLDHGNHRGQIFDREGNFVGGFGSRLYTAELR